jgi:DNA polymerase family A
VRDPLHRFTEIWLVDTEYVSRPGERPVPVCLVAWEFRTKRKIRLWRDELGTLPPYTLGPESLFVAYLASAEIGFHLALGWPKPARILDLYVEYRNRYNCLPTIVEQKLEKKAEKKVKKHSLIGALIQFGLDTIGVSEKQEMLDLILTGGPWTPAEKLAILDYCESDVAGLDRLLAAMLPYIDVPRGLYRGRFMAATASMEATGVPIDVELLTRLRDRWEQIEQELVNRVDAQYGVYDGTSFRNSRFERWLAAHEILWPRYANGELILKDKVFRDMAKIYPELNALQELRYSLSQLRLNDLAVGRDGFNRCMLSSFGTRSSRNSPSNTKFIFGPSVWLRGLIKPPAGFGLAYIDWSCQEIGVAAGLSGDSAMRAAYASGDVYLGFAKAAGAVPADATAETYPHERELYKLCMLGVSYGMEERSLALRIEQHLLIARSLLRHHHEIFWRFWEWSDNRVRRTMFTNVTYTVFGWKYHVTLNPKVRSIRNFPMQANGAEIMRLAVCLGVENGITICCSVHDAVLIMAPLDRLDSDIARMRTYMEQASELVLDGFKLRTEFIAVRYPDRYMDEERGRQFWDVVMSLL